MFLGLAYFFLVDVGLLRCAAMSMTRSGEDCCVEEIFNFNPSYWWWSGGVAEWRCSVGFNGILSEHNYRVEWLTEVRRCWSEYLSQSNTLKVVQLFPTQRIFYDIFVQALFLIEISLSDWSEIESRRNDSKMTGNRVILCVSHNLAIVWFSVQENVRRSCWFHQKEKKGPIT